MNSGDLARPLAGYCGFGTRTQGGGEIIAETLYFVIAALVVGYLVLMFMRLMKFTRRTYGEIRNEANRDRLQRTRIERQRYVQENILRKCSRRVNGKPRGVNWDSSDRGAARRHKYDNDIDRALASYGTRRYRPGVTVPWGWPELKANRPLIRPLRSKRHQSIRSFVGKRFATKGTVNKTADRLRYENSIAHLLEDRYGRVGYHNDATTIQWERPKLPRQLLKERQSDLMHARKLSNDEELNLKTQGELFPFKAKEQGYKKAG